MKSNDLKKFLQSTNAIVYFLLFLMMIYQVMVTAHGDIFRDLARGESVKFWFLYVATATSFLYFSIMTLYSRVLWEYWVFLGSSLILFLIHGVIMQIFSWYDSRDGYTYFIYHATMTIVHWFYLVYLLRYRYS